MDPIRVGENPPCEYFSVACDFNTAEIPKVIAAQCADPAVRLVSTTASNNIAVLVFARLLKYGGTTRMTVHDIIGRLKEVGREDLAEVLTPAHRSARLRSARDIAVMIAMVHDRAMGKDVDFHDIKGIREYGQS